MAATDTVAVVAAVTSISLEGRGTVTSVNGTSTCLVSCGSLGGGGGFGFGFSLSDCVVPLTPGGGRRSLGGTTSGLYEGKSARGTSSTGRGKTRGSGSRRDGSTGGSPKSITSGKDPFDKLNSFVIDIVVGRLSQFGQHVNNKTLNLFRLINEIRDWTDKGNHG